MNMQNLMAQAQKMQRDITKKKEEIDNTIFEGKSEWVIIKINGKKELVSLSIIYNSDLSVDDKEILEDMIKIAYNDAYKKVEKEIEEKMGTYAGGLGGLF